MTSSMNLLSFSSSALLRSEYSKSIALSPFVLRRTLAENGGNVNAHSGGFGSRSPQEKEGEESDENSQLSGDDARGAGGRFAGQHAGGGGPHASDRDPAPAHRQRH